MPAIIEGYSLIQTLGEMYECLTQDVLDCAVPPGLGLKVVRDFAIDGNGGTTGPLDCLLLRGEGIPVPARRASSIPAN